MALNAAPQVYTVKGQHVRKLSLAVSEDYDESSVEPIDSQEIFDMIRHVTDPEHPLTLEELKVLELENITVDNANNTVNIQFTPTIPHCSMATLIGLFIKVKLLRTLPRRFKVDIRITPGTHASELAVNKQINDKERVAAALTNENLLAVVNRSIANSDKSVEL